MKKVIAAVFAGIFILACSTSNFASPTETPRPTSVPFTIVPIMNEEYVTPQSGLGVSRTPTSPAQSIFTRPTPQVGNALAMLDSSVLFFTPSGEAWTALRDRLEYEVQLDSGSFNLPDNIQYALISSPTLAEQLIVIPAEITKIWLSNNRILGCSFPCKGEYVVLKGGTIDMGLMSLKEASLNTLADSIEFWSLQSALQHACYFSGQSVSKLQYCFRSVESFPTP